MPKAAYKDLIDNLSFLESIHNTLTSTLFIDIPCNLERKASTLSNSQSFSV